MRKLKIVILSFIVSMLFVISSSQIALSVVNYNENIYGDFPNWLTQNSSNIIVLNVGTNTILGTTTYYYSGTNDYDAIRFTIPEGMSLSEIDISLTNSGTGTVNNYALSLYSFDSSFNYSQISTWESGSPPVSNNSAFSDVLPLPPGNYAIIDSSLSSSFSEGQYAELHYAIEINVTGTSLPDTDEDGILDSFDNCLNIVNFEQTDSDVDGIGDVCDNFPNVPIITGDINNDGSVDLTDTLLATQVMVNIAPSVPVFKEADVNDIVINGGTIGLEEALYALQITSGVKSLPICGDGIVDAGEECDDGNQEDGDACTSTCTIIYRTVFLTSTTQTGNLGGLSGADTICNDLATTAQLPGTYKAWLSDDTTSPSESFTHHGQFVLVNGTPIANSWSDLIDYAILNPINVDENGNTQSYTDVVWSYTNGDGSRYIYGESCLNWSSESEEERGTGGYYHLSDYRWSYGGFTALCSNPQRLYCFEQ